MIFMEFQNNKDNVRMQKPALKDAGLQLFLTIIEINYNSFCVYMLYSLQMPILSNAVTSKLGMCRNISESFFILKSPCSMS